MSIVDDFPFPFQEPAARRLQELMAQLFPERREAILFVQQFGIDAIEISPDLPAIDLWEDLLRKLSKKGSVRKLVEEAGAKFSKIPQKAFLDELLADPPKLLKKAFIIQPVGDEAIRKRNDRVFEDLIRPACLAAAFDAERADKYSDKAINEPITSPLFGHPLVVADLGNLSSVSPNVMIEAGFRLATGGPIVLLADAPLPASMPFHLSENGILEIIPSDPKASLKELESRIRASCSPARKQSKQGGWTSEHPWVDWRYSLSSPWVYLDANQKAASLYGLANANEIIGHPVAEIDDRLCDFMDPEYREAFINEQKTILGRIIVSLHEKKPLVTGATLPLIFSKHPDPDKLKTVHYPVIVNYKIDEKDDPDSVVFRTVYLQIEKWCAKDIMERCIADRELPLAFRAIYDSDFFLCYDTADFQLAEDLRAILTRSGFTVWWPDQHNRGKDRELSAVDLKVGLAKSRIAAVLVGSPDRMRWGKSNPELDKALYKHCASNKPLILFLLPKALDLEPTLDNWLGSPYDEVLSEPVYVKWPEIRGILSNDSPTKSLGRILREVVKLLHLPNS